MEKKTFKVPNIGCNGCANAIKGELGDVDGVKTVDAVVDSKMVTVEYDSPASWEKIVATLTEIDYAPEQA
ncbi:MAG: heavy-metal-associated domain-containing protein [Anaerolineae bacterium]|nr:heavy-metal-associated domain-containing protein [Anaerolineae bacterium]MDQ7036788.1 heavy-metal-associated domain-containing protein [Anaerolineae bacterium]